MGKKFKSPEPLPTPRERELLVILIEECAEVQHRATKLLRFGRNEVQEGQPYSNMARLSQEVGDLVTMLDLLANVHLLDPEIVRIQMTEKTRKLAKYLQSDEGASA